MGVDMMDCVLPTRAARHGLLFRSAEAGEEGIAVRMNIKRMPSTGKTSGPLTNAAAVPVVPAPTRAPI